VGKKKKLVWRGGKRRKRARLNKLGPTRRSGERSRAKEKKRTSKTGENDRKKVTADVGGEARTKVKSRNHPSRRGKGKV